MKTQAAMLMLMLAQLAAGASDSPATPASTQASTLATQSPEIPEAELRQMYARELGKSYDDAQFRKLLTSHRLLETYFADGAARKSLTAKIEATGIDPNVLGKLCRLRLHWPELAPGVYYINERFGPHAVYYFLGVPKNYVRSVASPLVVMLPTADVFLAEPKPNADQVTAIYTEWMTQELAKHPDALVIMPLLNLDQLYGPSYMGMNTVMQPILHVYERVNFDPARVYLIGHAMSGHAVWNLGLHFTTYFGGLNPFAGGASADWQRVRLMNLRNTPVFAWHDANDPISKVENQRKLIQLLRKKFKYDIDYDETQRVGHQPTDEIVQRAYAKLRSRSRALYPPTVSLQSNRPDAVFNRLDWLQVYQPLKTGEEQRNFFRWGVGYMITYTNSFKLEATLAAGNRIDATSDNVASMRFHVNDQMIDFAKAVTVFVNRRAVFEGFLKPSVDEMLQDQLFLGRGWRYFTAVIDVDLGGKPSTKPSSKPATQSATQSAK